MLKWLHLNIGDLIYITADDEGVYKSDLQDVYDEQYLMLATPLYKGIPVLFHKGQEVVLGYFRETGRYALSARVAGFHVEGNLRFVLFEPFGQPVRRQLRNAYRLADSLRCIVRRGQDGPFPAQRTPEDDALEVKMFSLDISETGIGLKSPFQFDPEEQIYLHIYLAWPTPDAPPIEAVGQVRRQLAPDPKTKLSEIGVAFIGLDSETSRTLSRYVLVRQQALLKQRRLVDDR